AAPVVIYFHGGAWIRWHKDDNSYQAPAFVDRNITFVSVNFSLVPKVSLDQLIYECRTSVNWIWRNAASFDADPERLFIAGHSSGAHIVGLLAVTNWKREWSIPSNVIKGAIAASGMYDLEPVKLSSRNNYLKLDNKAVERNSAIRQIPNKIPPMIIAYGAKEQIEFRRQSIDFATRLRQLTHPCAEMDLPNLNHFQVGEEFARQGSPLMRKIYSLIGV
ncbi:MAG: hypothetical protein CMF69_07695, partial [Magnetovibrio sp.]|nr:hypothetical protein [Magnetovibrio sp.]